MSRPNNLRGTYVTILAGNGASPEVFVVLCGITTKSITDQVNTSDAFNRDCDEPEEVPVRQIITSGRQWSLRGSGQLNRDQFDLLEGLVGKSNSYRYFIAAKESEVAGDNPLNGYYGGKAVLTNKTINGDDGQYVNVDVSFESDGAWAWNDVALT